MGSGSSHASSGVRRQLSWNPVNALIDQSQNMYFTYSCPIGVMVASCLKPCCTLCQCPAVDKRHQCRPLPPKHIPCYGRDFLCVALWQKSSLQAPLHLQSVLIRHHNLHAQQLLLSSCLPMLTLLRTNTILPGLSWTCPPNPADAVVPLDCVTIYGCVQPP